MVADASAPTGVSPRPLLQADLGTPPLQADPGRPLPVLVVHNAYQQPGGEDAVVESEIDLLRERGHAVAVYRRSNDEIAAMPAASLALQTLWSRRSAGEVAALVQRHRPAIIHVHNSFPLISPAVYWAAARAEVPVVQTLHNFRLVCPQAMFWRDNQPCQDCLGHPPWRAVRHACYRGSHVQSAAVALLLQGHRWLGSWQHKVSRYIAANDFCRDRFIAGGLPAERIDIKPHFVPTPAAATLAGQRQGFVFVGRLSPEKGLATLLQAAVLAGQAGQPCPLRVVGDGPERWRLADLSQLPAGLQPLGALPRSQAMAEMAGALALVVPSIVPESFGLVVAEAFACGTPVICSRVGALPSLVEDGQTGWLFEPGDSGALAQRLRWAMAHPQALRAAGARAQAYHAIHLTAQCNYRQLQAIYARAISGGAAQPLHFGG